MSVLIGILLALFVFFIVVFIHEMGHFLVARWSGVTVKEFGIGIPPRFKKLFHDKRGTEWTLNWIPLGGFVRLKGENFVDYPTTSPTPILLPRHEKEAALEWFSSDAFPQAPWWKQVAILLAGVTMNFLLAGFLFGLLFYRGTEPLTVHIRELAPQALLSHVGVGTQLIPIFDTVEDAEKAKVLTRAPGVVLDPLPDSLAARAGLERGDIALSIDGNVLTNPSEIQERLATSIPVQIHIRRGEEEKDISITPIDGKIGAYIAPNITLMYYQYDIIRSFFYGMREVYNQIGFSFRTFGAIITTSFSDTASREQKQEATAGIGGPVAIGRVFVGLADYGVELRSIIILTAMISLSLGVFNLLPFPALDGGRCLIVIVNQIIHIFNPRFKISPRIEQMIHSIGFMILILMSILITWKDIFIR